MTRSGLLCKRQTIRNVVGTLWVSVLANNRESWPCGVTVVGADVGAAAVSPEEGVEQVRKDFQAVELDMGVGGGWM